MIIENMQEFFHHFLKNRLVVKRLINSGKLLLPIKHNFNKFSAKVT